MVQEGLHTRKAINQFVRLGCVIIGIVHLVGGVLCLAARRSIFGFASRDVGLCTSLPTEVVRRALRDMQKSGYHLVSESFEQSSSLSDYSIRSTSGPRCDLLP